MDLMPSLPRVYGKRRQVLLGQADLQSQEGQPQDQEDGMWKESL